MQQLLSKMSVSSNYTSNETRADIDEYKDLYWIYHEDDDEDLKISWPSMNDGTKKFEIKKLENEIILDTTSVSDLSDIAPRRDSLKLLGNNIKVWLPSFSTSSNKMNRIDSECSITPYPSHGRISASTRTRNDRDSERIIDERGDGIHEALDDSECFFTPHWSNHYCESDDSEHEPEVGETSIQKESGIARKSSVEIKAVREEESNGN